MHETVTWTIAQLTEWVNAVITETLGGEIWIEGEITNISRSAKGHVYFTLIEPGASHGAAPHSLAVTLFNWHRQNVNQHLTRSGGSVRMDNGVRVRIRGGIEIYGARSQLQMKMTGIDPAFTLGTMAADRERLLRTLAAEGLLEANHRRLVAAIPERVVLITSLNSAAHADFCHEMERGDAGVELLMIDSRVQGGDAAASLCAALSRAVGLAPDVIAIVRGGGAATDLAVFDHEAVVRAVASSPVAVWCGIGHETDHSVVDEVAHTSFKTPTACAAGIVEHAQRGVDDLEGLWTRVCDAAGDRLDGAERDLRRGALRTSSRTRDRFERASNRLRNATHRTSQQSHRHLSRADARLDEAARALTSALPRRLDEAARTLDALGATVRAYDPVHVLARGYSITRGPDGRMARRGSLREGDELETVLADGTVRSTVHDVVSDGSTS